MKDIFVVYSWPEYEDTPEYKCAVSSESDAQEWFFPSGECCIRLLSLLFRDGVCLLHE